MTELVGNLSLGLGVLVAALSGLAAIAAARFESDSLMRGARGLMGIYLALIAVASGALVIALLNNDFRFQYVANYSERALPFGYKLAAFWAGQAGSLLLWALMLAGFSVIYVVTRKHESHREAAGSIVTLAIINVFFVSLMLFAERPATETAPATHANPFSLAEVVPADGHGLNPMLQDPAMIAHPPALFLGYAGFAVPFAMLIGALVAGRKDNEWVAQTRRWILASWLFLTIGIILGAEWAYVELGWGGYWAWDPVENASLLPWLTGTALLHSIMVQQSRGMLKLWNAVLIALTFILCIFGTYITRSGVIDSVHSFGQSIIGTFFLVFLIILSVFAVGTIVARRGLLRSENHLEGLLSREGLFLATNILLVAMMIATMVGTMFPVISRLFTGQQITPKTDFYNRTVAPMGLVLVAMMAMGPVLGYGKDAARRLIKSSIAPGIIAAGVVGAFIFKGVLNGWALACAAICTVVIANIGIELVRSIVNRIKNTGENPVTALLRILDGNHRRYGGQIVHLGVMLMVAGIVGSSLFSQKQSFQMQAGESVQFGGQTLTLVELRETRKVNFTAVEAIVKLTDRKGNESTLQPQRRFYDKAEEANSEVAIQTGWRQDVYLTLAGWEQGGKVTTIETIINPLVSWIWVGGIVLTIGTIFALLPRLVPVAANVTEDEKQDKKVVAARPTAAAM